MSAKQRLANVKRMMIEGIQLDFIELELKQMHEFLDEPVDKDG